MTPDKPAETTLAARLEARLATHDFGGDASHDLHHCRRVLRAALEIAEEEGGSADREVLIAAAYLHDIVNLPKDHPERALASLQSARASEPILTELGFSTAKIAATTHAIETHSFSAGKPPRTEEARILQDADRLESLGAIGIARTFYIAGRLGAQLFDPADPLAANRPLNDKAFALDHFAVKLLRLPATMQTAAGRRRAEALARVMEAFVAQIASEIGGAAASPLP